MKRGTGVNDKADGTKGEKQDAVLERPLIIRYSLYSALTRLRGGT